MSCNFFINPYKSYISAISEEWDNKINQIHKFHKSLPGYSATSLENLPQLAGKSGVNSILIKDESKRFGIQTFKALGASWTIHSYLKENPGKYTFCTATDGNHGRAVAWSARIHKQNAIVFLPAHTVKSRILNIENEGAEVKIIQGDYDTCVRISNETARQNGYILVQDTSWTGYEKIPALITEGYYTQFHEIFQQLKTENNKPPFDIVFLQSGVGSWAASVATYLQNTFVKNKPKIVIVEPTNSDCILESIRNGKLSKTKGSQDTIMAGLNCGTPSTLAFETLRKLADVFISIPDDNAKIALKLLQNPIERDPGIESCETGAAGLAGYLAVIYSPELSGVRNFLKLSKKSRILLINTEGNTDPVMNAKIMSEKIVFPWDKNFVNN
jgi:diaminopropionate ammonia-lyase